MAAPSQAIGSANSSPPGDGLDLLDLSEYETVSYQSPSLSPSAANKIQFARPTQAISTTPTTMPANQMLCGPSHQYDQYKQQTPFVPGALANTLALNESSTHMAGYSVDYINPGEEIFNFNAGLPHDSMTTPNMDIDFGSPAESNFFFPTTPTVNPHTATTTSPITTQTAGVGRMYPGMHQRAAMAKAQHMQQQKQQQDIIQNQRRQQQNKQTRPKIPPTDPIVEQKITQLLNSMRSKASTSEQEDDSPLLQVPRPKKEEDEMDEDERLLASEEGKKLSSKERRQLRNKVSARAFRSRRKEYIGQLENEISTKVKENSDLRAANFALSAENKRLTDLTKMLLSSPAFSSFLDVLSTNPAALSQPQGQMEQRQPEPTQAPKDANPYHAINSGQQQQIGMVMMPEQRIDMSMLNLSTDGFYQPQVFAVLDTPELPQIDTDTLAGKSSNFVGEAPATDSDKTDAPAIEAPIPSIIEKPQTPDVKAEPAHSDKIASNLNSDIFEDDCSPPSSSSPQPLELDTDGFSAVDIFGGIEPEKALARYELVDSLEEDKLASMALRRVERLATSLAVTIARLERLDLDL